MQNKVKRFKVSDYRKVFVVGDIHGCFSLLEKCLYSIQFDKERDLLIAVGDLVGRGQESYMAVDYLKKDWFYSAIGNHDIMFFDHEEEYSFLYSQIDQVELDLIKHPEWVSEFWNVCKEKMYFFIELEHDDGQISLVNHSAFKLESMADYLDFKKSVEKSKSKLKKSIWNRSLRVILKDKNYLFYNREKYNKRLIENYHNDYKVDGIKGIFVGHNVISIPSWYTGDKAEKLTLGDYYFLETGAFFTDKHFSIGQNLDEIDYGMTVFNITDYRFELINKR